MALVAAAPPARSPRSAEMIARRKLGDHGVRCVARFDLAFHDEVETVEPFAVAIDGAPRRQIAAHEGRAPRGRIRRGEGRHRGGRYPERCRRSASGFPSRIKGWWTRHMPPGTRHASIFASLDRKSNAQLDACAALLRFHKSRATCFMDRTMIEHTPLIITLSMIAAFLVGLSKGGLPSVGAAAVPLLAHRHVAGAGGGAAAAQSSWSATWWGSTFTGHHFSARNLAILTPGLDRRRGHRAGISRRRCRRSSSAFSSAWSASSFASTPGSARGFAPPCVKPTCLAACSGARSPALTSFVSHTGAPPFQMYVLPQQLDKLTFAGTTTVLFAIVNAVKLIPYWQLGQFSQFDTTLVLWLAPVSLLGALAGRRITGYIPEWLFFRLIQVALMILSLKLVFDYLKNARHITRMCASIPELSY